MYSSNNEEFTPGSKPVSLKLTRVERLQCAVPHSQSFPAVEWAEDGRGGQQTAVPRSLTPLPKFHAEFQDPYPHPNADLGFKKKKKSLPPRAISLDRARRSAITATPLNRDT